MNSWETARIDEEKLRSLMSMPLSSDLVDQSSEILEPPLIAPLANKELKRFQRHINACTKKDITYTKC